MFFSNVGGFYSKADCIIAQVSRVAIAGFLASITLTVALAA